MGKSQIPTGRFEGSRKLVLFNEIKPSKSFESFRQRVSHGDSGLCITRRSTYHIVSEYDLGDAEYKSLESEGLVDTVNPEDLHQIEDVIGGFAAENEKPVFLIDGIDYLIALNSVDEVTDFLGRVRHRLEEHGGSLLASLDLGTFDSGECVKIAKCFDEVEEL
ncbi:MAG: DUF835 domain-containing protein [Thermoplasmata archaeon]